MQEKTKFLFLETVRKSDGTWFFPRIRILRRLEDPKEAIHGYGIGVSYLWCRYPAWWNREGRRSGPLFLLQGNLQNNQHERQMDPFGWLWGVEPLLRNGNSKSQIPNSNIQISSNYQPYEESFLWPNFMSFGHWFIGYYLVIGACLPAGRQGVWLLIWRFCIPQTPMVKFTFIRNSYRWPFLPHQKSWW